jgi:putative Mg2+ transporter-C (MgtC) family protein
MFPGMRWLTENWHHLLPSPWAPVVLAPLAAICGALVGMEREHKEKPAGVRTMSMVGLGAALFTMVGFAFVSSTGDSGRVAAQIVTGVGFLGGGVILRSKGGIHGVTTAATIWAVAAMGMVFGAGYAPAGVATALLILGVLNAVGWFERSRFGGSKVESIGLVFDPDHGRTEIKLGMLFQDYGVGPQEAPVETADGLKRLTLHFRMTARHHRDFLLSLTELPEIRTIERGDL